jgi:hypothetical protein
MNAGSLDVVDGATQRPEIVPPLRKEPGGWDGGRERAQSRPDARSAGVPECQMSMFDPIGFRHQFKEIPHRSRYRKNNPRKPRA